tara:strand:- start:425 stop:685 length:261 start_codon:yes stop_codon:yes gene_type:complete
MAETMNRPNPNSIFSRLEYIRKAMGRPNTSAKEMKTLQLREDNLLEMLHEGMDEFKKGGKVIRKKTGGRVRGDGIAIKGRTKGTMR